MVNKFSGLQVLAALISAVLLSMPAAAAGEESYEFAIVARDRAIENAVNRWASDSGTRVAWRCRECSIAKVELSEEARARFNERLRSSHVSDLDSALKRTLAILNNEQALRKPEDLPPLHLYIFAIGDYRAAFTDTDL